MTTSFATSFTATELEARDAVRRIIRDLHQDRQNPSWALDVEIALAEAVNNVVEHAYADEVPGNIKILCSWDPDVLDVEIQDSGVPFPEGTLPTGNPPDLAVPRQDLPEGGFGWFLIRKLASTVSYDRCCGRNQLKLRFDISAPAK